MQSLEGKIGAQKVLKTSSLSLAVKCLHKSYKLVRGCSQLQFSLCSAPTDYKAEVWTTEVTESQRPRPWTIHADSTEVELAVTVKFSKCLVSNSFQWEKGALLIDTCWIFQQVMQKLELIFVFLPVCTLWNQNVVWNSPNLNLSSNVCKGIVSDHKVAILVLDSLIYLEARHSWGIIWFLPSHACVHG